ncbi:hypothetical protein K439DRAFT_115000 [Ramaria rubella]|nr:hypothetical protein K439DRAFT_115000 [Ramaria rubella]
MPSSSGPPGIDLTADQCWWRWCSHARNYRGFDRHQELCKHIKHKNQVVSVTDVGVQESSDGQQALSQINYTDYLLDENDTLQAQKLKRSTSLESEDEGAGAQKFCCYHDPPGSIHLDHPA